MIEHQPNVGLASLYGVYRADLLRFLTARTGDAGEAEELLQELWIKAQQSPGGPVTHGRAYLYRMAQNMIVDRLRERQRRSRRERVWADDATGYAPLGIEPADARPNAEEAMIDGEELARLAVAISTLPEGARRAFELHKVEGLSHTEVAVRLGISKSGVEKHMAVAMKYLRRAMIG